LIRGLRRGIGLFIDEVSFPSYRRIIQKLASNGKLGVVISDGSLAFGVNMPFRTTIFCSEMRGNLDELMSQQMSGRAGRRGLDEQGNVIYAGGIRYPMLKRLMIGKITHITGRYGEHLSSSSLGLHSGSEGNKGEEKPTSSVSAVSLYPPTKYETLFLQSVLSPRYTGYARNEILGKTTLYEFIHGLSSSSSSSTSQESYVMSYSKNMMMDLGLIIASSKTKDYQPNPAKKSNFALLSSVWEMRNYIYESFTIAMLLSDIIGEFYPLCSKLSIQTKKANTERLEPFIYSFFVIIVQLIGRKQAKKNTVKLLDLSYFTSHPEHRQFYDKWNAKFRKQQEYLRSKGYPSHLLNPVSADMELDGTFFQCAVDRK
jgi:hypothetical protein